MGRTPRRAMAYRDGQMRAALDHEAQARIAHQRNSAWQALHTPSGMSRVERYQTSDPTLSLATVQDGRPVYDFAAAPSLFVEEDLRQEKHMLQHRKDTCELLKAAEVMEAQTVANRIDSESAAQAALAAERAAAANAAECREIEVRSVEQRSAIEAACTDAEHAARAAIARAHEQNVLPLLPLQRQLQRLHAMLRQWPWRLGVHRIVPLLSVVAVRLRATASR